MAGYQPVAGESVGVMVVAGSTRSDHQTPVEARTNVLEIAWPDAQGENPARVVWREGSTAPPVPGPTPDDEFDLQELFDLGADIAQAVASLSVDVLELNQRLEALKTPRGGDPA
jgi:hypothetical protein